MLRRPASGDGPVANGSRGACPGCRLTSPERAARAPDTPSRPVLARPEFCLLAYTGAAGCRTTTTVGWSRSSAQHLDPVDLTAGPAVLELVQNPGRRDPGRRRAVRSACAVRLYGGCGLWLWYGRGGVRGGRRSRWRAWFPGRADELHRPRRGGGRGGGAAGGVPAGDGDRAGRFGEDPAGRAGGAAGGGPVRGRRVAGVAGGGAGSGAGCGGGDGRARGTGAAGGPSGRGAGPGAGPAAAA